MKTQHISIFSGNADGNSAADASTNPMENQPGGLASYRARYQAFLSQQSPKSQRRNYGPSALVRFTQVVINFAIFIVLFVAILTLFGFGLTWLNSDIKVVKEDAAASPKQAVMAATVPSPTAKKKTGKR